MDLHAPPCCATVGDLGHNGPDTVTWSGRYGGGIKKNEKRRKKKKKKKKKSEKREPLSESLPRFHGLMTFLRPLVAGQKRSLL